MNGLECWRDVLREMLIFIADNFQALIQYSDAIGAQTGKAVRCHPISTSVLFSRVVSKLSRSSVSFFSM